jgi:hypothetical protein
MATPVLLNNTSNSVTIGVSQADNFISIYLNPDSTSLIGSVKVFESFANGMAGGPNATLPLSNYLAAMKKLNPSVTNIVLVVSAANYAGGGGIAYTISGSGITLPAVNLNLATYTSQLNAYQINIF